MQPIPVLNRKQLFIDTTFIEASEGVTQTMNPPYQTGEVLLTADQPWEQGAYVGSYCSVIKEARDGRECVRVWYDLISGEGRPGSGYRVVAYAESDDGIHFHKPVLSQVEWEGSQENNFVIPTDLSRFTVGGGSVGLDENPNCPSEERYKSWSKLYSTPGSLSGGHQLWHSADGIRWHRYTQPTTGLGASDTQPTWFWDADLGRYVGYSREWVQLGPGRRNRTRMASYNESDDMLAWDNAHMALKSDERDMGAPTRDGSAVEAGETSEDQVVNVGAPMDIYGPGVFKYDEAQAVYIATFSAFYHWRPAGEKTWPDTADVQLAVSRNGRQFQRLGDRQPFLRLGPLGSFYSKWIWPCPRPIRMGDELWFYYMGTNKDHARRPDPTAAKTTSALTRAILRLDGFVSVDAHYGGGELTTPPIVFEGSELELNLDTSAGGSVRVEIQDASGRPISGHTLEEADELNGNSVRMPVSWRGSHSVAALAGKPVKLHFRMRDCKLYAFQFQR